MAKPGLDTDSPDGVSYPQFLSLRSEVLQQAGYDGNPVVSTLLRVEHSYTTLDISRHWLFKHARYGDW